MTKFCLLQEYLTRPQLLRLVLLMKVDDIQYLLRRNRVMLPGYIDKYRYTHTDRYKYNKLDGYCSREEYMYMIYRDDKYLYSFNKLGLCELSRQIVIYSAETNRVYISHYHPESGRIQYISYISADILGYIIEMRHYLDGTLECGFRDIRLVYNRYNPRIFYIYVRVNDMGELILDNKVYLRKFAIVGAVIVRHIRYSRIHRYISLHSTSDRIKINVKYNINTWRIIPQTIIVTDYNDIELERIAIY
jgi:hypothetical protein